MKKLISAVLFALSGISAPIFAQSDIKQMSFPKHIYIGDTAEIHYTFGSGVDFFPDEESVDEKNLLFSTLPFKSDNNDFTVLETKPEFRFFNKNYASLYLSAFR